MKKIIITESQLQYLFLNESGVDTFGNTDKDDVPDSLGSEIGTVPTKIHSSDGSEDEDLVNPVKADDIQKFASRSNKGRTGFGLYY